MSLIRLVDVSRYFGARKLFSSVHVTVEPGDRIGLIGRNGTGKTTLLRMITGLDAPDQGSVVQAARLQVGYLAQETGLPAGGDTPYAIVRDSLDHLTELADDMRRCEAAMQAGPTADELERLMARYAKLSERFEREGGYEMDARIRSVLLGLGLGEEQLYQDVATMSGGERERVALAALLVREPDFLILDEPTNHLDIAAVEWLEQFLRAYRGAFLVVSHDRAFLDAVAQRIWELDEVGGVAVYRGNFSAAQTQRQERLARLAKEYEAQREEIERLEAYVRRNRAGTRAGQARSRERRLARMERIERPAEEGAGMQLTVQQSSARGSREVVRFESVSHHYDDAVVLRDMNFTVERGERIGIIGPNGSGKTTLLNLLTQRLDPTSGHVFFGRDIDIGYYRQHFEGLDPKRAVIDEVLDARHMTVPEARNYLARFLFRGDDVYKQVGVLSGGESRRLMLAKLLLSPANLLCLDEPTNHLDIPGREALEAALQDFTGTLIFVSHDRYFLSQLAQRLVVLGNEPGQWEIVEGGYEAWRRLEAERAQAAMEARRESSVPSPRTTRHAAAPNRASVRAARAAVRELEAHIEALEEAKAAIEKALADSSLYADPDKVREVSQEYHQVKLDLDAAYETWSEQIEQIEQVEPESS